MAIIVNSRNSRSGIVAFLIWLVLILVVVAGAYYVFFKRPELVPISAPPGFEEARRISKIRLNSREVLDNPKFRALRFYITPSQPASFGKSNPFLGDRAGK